MVSPPSISNHPTSGRFSPAGPDTPGEREHSRRRGSFSFLRRTKSGTPLPTPKVPLVGKLNKKRGSSKEHEMGKEPIPNIAPRIPDIPHPAQLQTFGGENAKPILAGSGSARIEISPAKNMGYKVYSSVPIPPTPGLAQDLRGEYADVAGRNDSMTHRGRHSYASSAITTINNPRRMRRRKDPTPFKYVRTSRV